MTSKRYYMKLYVKDYIGDTQHLTATEHGAYLLLLMYCFMHDRLPDDDASQRRIARVPKQHWPRVRKTLMPFFEGSDGDRLGVTNKRTSREVTKMTEISNKRKAAAEQMLINKAANADILYTIDKSKSKSPTGGEEPPPAQLSPQGEVYKRGKEVLGKKAGGIIRRILAAYEGNIALTRSLIEKASAMADPVEYVMAALRNLEANVREAREDKRRRGALI